MSDSPDQNLVRKYLKGDKNSLEILIKKYLSPIFNFVLRLVENKQDAEDITQEVFVKVWKNIKKFNQKKSFKTWLFTIAKNTAFDSLRKKKVAYFSDLENEEGKNWVVDSLADPSPLPPEILERKELARDLERALKKLPPKMRVVLLLYYNDHLTLREIAEVLDEPLNTVKSRCRRALMMLRKLLAKK